MDDVKEIDSALLATLAPRLQQLSRLVGPEPHGPAAVAVARGALAAAADVPLAFAGVVSGPVESVWVERSLRRAVRLLEPTLRARHAHVVFDTGAEHTVIQADEGGLLRLFVLLLRDLLLAAGDLPTVTVATSAGGAGALVWLSTHADGEPTGSLTHAEHAHALARRLGVELAPAPTAGTRAGHALRLELPRTPRAVAPLRLEASLRVVSSAAAPATPPAPAPAPRAVRGDPTPVPQSIQRAVDEIAIRAAHAMTAFHTFVPVRRVLVVDDDENIASFLQAALPTAGMEVEVAASAEEALELVRPGHFSLALIDKNLPTSSGLELLGSLRDVDPELGAVLMTAYSSARALSAALELGVYDYIDKPFPVLPIFLGRIEIALRRHALHTRVGRLARQVTSLGAALPADLAALDEGLSRVHELLSTAGTANLSVLVFATRDVAQSVFEPLEPLTGMTVTVTTSHDQARAALHRSPRPDCVIVEPVAMAGQMAAFLAACRSGSGPATRVWAATRDESLGPALDALAAGVDDYLLLGELTPDQLRRRLRNGLARLRLRLRDRAVLLELLGVDIDHMPAAAPPTRTTAGNASEERGQ